MSLKCFGYKQVDISCISVGFSIFNFTVNSWCAFYFYVALLVPSGWVGSSVQAKPQENPQLSQWSSDSTVDFGCPSESIHRRNAFVSSQSVTACYPETAAWLRWRHGFGDPSLWGCGCFSLCTAALVFRYAFTGAKQLWGWSLEGSKGRRKGKPIESCERQFLLAFPKQWNCPLV